MDVLTYAGSAIIAVWGIGHLAATKSVVRGFGPLSEDNRRIILMEWIAEGMTLSFLGVLAALPVGSLVRFACAAALVALAVLSALTGARTSIGPMRACPYVKSAVAALWILGGLVQGP